MFSDAVIIALITAVPSTLAALAGLVVSILNGRKIEVVRTATDGLVERGRQDAGIIAHAEGVIQGKAEEQANPTSGFGALKP